MITVILVSFFTFHYFLAFLWRESLEGACVWIYPIFSKHLHKSAYFSFLLHSQRLCLDQLRLWSIGFLFLLILYSFPPHKLFNRHFLFILRSFGLLLYFVFFIKYSIIEKLLFSLHRALSEDFGEEAVLPMQVIVAMLILLERVHVKCIIYILLFCIYNYLAIGFQHIVISEISRIPKLQIFFVQQFDSVSQSQFINIILSSINNQNDQQVMSIYQNNRQAVSLQKRSIVRKQKLENELKIEDVKSIQILSILLGNVGCKQEQHHGKLINNAQKNLNVKQCRFNKYQTNRKVQINQLLAQFGNVDRQNQCNQQLHTHINHQKQQLNKQKTNSPLKKLALRSQTKYSQNSPKAKQQNYKYQKLPIYSVSTGTNQQAPSHRGQQEKGHKNKLKKQRFQQENRHLKQSAVTFSPLRIDISLPSLCSEDLDQLQQQRQIISEIEKDINLLINKIKSNHFEDSPQKVKVQININQNTNNKKTSNYQTAFNHKKEKQAKADNVKLNYKEIHKKAYQTIDRNTSKPIRR